MYCALGGDALVLELVVLCPRTGALEPIGGGCDSCGACGRVRLAACGHRSELRCNEPSRALAGDFDGDDTTLVAAALAEKQICVPATLLAGDVERLIDGLGLTAVVVVDDTRRPVGVVTPTTLLRSNASSALRSACDVMEPLALILPPTTPLERAAAAMAYESAAVACVIDERGGFVGLLTPIEVLRLLSISAGYLLGSAKAPLESPSDSPAPPLQ